MVTLHAETVQPTAGPTLDVGRLLNVVAESVEEIERSRRLPDSVVSALARVGRCTDSPCHASSGGIEAPVSDVDGRVRAAGRGRRQHGMVRGDRRREQPVRRLPARRTTARVVFADPDQGNATMFAPTGTHRRSTVTVTCSAGGGRSRATACTASGSALERSSTGWTRHRVSPSFRSRSLDDRGHVGLGRPPRHWQPPRQPPATSSVDARSVLHLRRPTLACRNDVAAADLLPSCSRRSRRCRWESPAARSTKSARQVREGRTARRGQLADDPIAMAEFATADARLRAAPRRAPRSGRRSSPPRRPRRTGRPSPAGTNPRGVPPRL